MQPKQMIELMERIARNLILEEQFFKRDFEEQVRYYARSVESRTPFYWLISENGCELVCKSDEKAIAGLALQINFYIIFRDTVDMYLYEFDGEELMPVSRKKFLKQEMHKV